MIHCTDCTEELRTHYGCICDMPGESIALVNWSNARRKGRRIGLIGRLSLWLVGDPLVSA